jgi:hypothetical protein
MPATDVGPRAEARERKEAVADNCGGHVDASEEPRPVLGKSSGALPPKARSAGERGDAPQEYHEPVPRLNVHRRVAALTQLALHFKRLRERTVPTPGQQ